MPASNTSRSPHSFHSSLEFRPSYLLGYDPGEEIEVETFSRIARCRFNSRDSPERICRKQAWNNLLQKRLYLQDRFGLMYVCVSIFIK